MAACNGLIQADHSAIVFETNWNTVWPRQMRFNIICEASDIEYRLTKPNHPWTNGQVERMNCTIRERYRQALQLLEP